MKLIDQVCSLELAKQLEQLGVIQESYFYWYLTKNNGWELELEINEDYGIDKASAFTASELLELLPADININKNEPFNHFKLNILPIKSVDNRIPPLLELEKLIEALKVWKIDYLCDTSEYNDLFRRHLFNKPVYNKNIATALAMAYIRLHEMELLK